MVVLDRVWRARTRLDAELLEAVTGVVTACRERVLVEQDLVGQVLTAGQQDRVLADTKRRAVTETATALGVKIGEARTLVSLAMAGAEVLTTVVDALGRGETSWPQLRRFWDLTGSSTRALSPDQQLLVTLSLFGTDPALAAVERRDPDGELTLGTPWPQARFEAALAREVTACEGTDVSTERERRRRAYSARRASVRVHDDGTGTFSVRGPLHKVLAAHARHDDVARSLRAAGHPDSLAQLAADSVLATLTHGTLGPGAASDIDELSDADLDDLIAVVNGHPRIALQVVVPADVLGLGHPVCATCATDLTTSQPQQQERTTGRRNRGTDGGAHGPADGAARGTADGGADDDAEHDAEPQLPFDHAGDTPDWARPAAESLAREEMPCDRRAREDSATDHARGQPDGEELARTEPAHGAVWGYDPELRRGRGMVGEIIGSHPAFITPGLARELFYTPGTTLHRLLTDPADGRCLERTIASYRPDTDMRRQVRAADLYSRHPLSRGAGRALEIDHVIPFGTEPGGTTTEPNLANLDLRTHKIKTARELTIAINTRRDLTFTTLLRQSTRSRVHDYSQYLRTAHPEHLDDRRDLANLALYAGLAHQPEHRHRPGLDTWLMLDHTDPTTGQTRPGPPPQPQHPHTLLGITDERSGHTDDDPAGGTDDAR